ncbi:MAG: hypothetical protein KJS77_04605 [Planctomycetes bacterium]|nr:hypothetical protein [Planctomycetota bacterium]
MITTHEQLADSGTIPVVGLPPDTAVERMPLAGGGVFELALVTIPTVEAATHDAVIAELVGRAASWVSAAAPGGDPPLTVPLYGTHVVWGPRRAAAIGPTDRLAAMRSAIIEFADREAELRDIEREIAAALPHVDRDSAVAFEADDHALSRRKELSARFTAAISLRRRLAVLAPVLQRPAPQPPTLAGQLGERLRDRTRVVERLEHAAEQADLLERVYSGCGDRVAEFVSSRRHLTLEWVIILLLAAEVVLITIDLLANHTP